MCVPIIQLNIHLPAPAKHEEIALLKMKKYQSVMVCIGCTARLKTDKMSKRVLALMHVNSGLPLKCCNLDRFGSIDFAHVNATGRCRGDAIGVQPDTILMEAWDRICCRRTLPLHILIAMHGRCRHVA